MTETTPVPEPTEINQLGDEKPTHSAIRCKKCGDVIESKYRHDWVSCSCGACFVDGGYDYCRIGGNFEDIEVLATAGENGDD